MIMQVVTNETVEENIEAALDTKPNLTDKLLSSENQNSAFSK